MKIFQVFESYPLFYQPYIRPVLKELSKAATIKLIAYRGSKEANNDVFILPNYWNRKLYEKYHKLISNKVKELSYIEIKALKESAKIIHIQHSYLFNKVLGLLEWSIEERPKIVITLRGGDTYVKPWTSKKWQDFYKNYGDKVDAFIVMSEDQKEYLSRWGVPLNSIHVIPISFGNRFEIAPKLPNKSQLKLVSVFRMCWEKNITDNVRLVKKIKDKGIPVSYDVYGNGPDIGQLYYLRDKFDLKKEITILGKVPNEALKQKLRDYDFTLQLSLSESLGMSIIEAQAYGVPAIVSNNGGLPEIISNRKNGFVVSKENTEEIAQVIIKLWENMEKYKKMSQASINMSQENYNLDKEVAKLTALYKALIA